MIARFYTIPLAVSLLLVHFAGCGSRSGNTTGTTGSQETSIRVEGSDTMVNLAQAWAETYHGKHPDVSV